MLKVEVINKNGKERLIINNILVDEKVHFLFQEGKLHDISLEDDLVDILIKYSFKDIFQFIVNFYYDKDVKVVDFVKRQISVYISNYNNDSNSPIVDIILRLDFKSWKNPYSIIEFSDTLSQSLVSNNEITFVSFDYFFEDDGNAHMNFSFSINENLLTIENAVSNIVNTTKRIIQNAHQTLLANLEKDLIISYFTFPEEIKVACKQYLTYFAQFLMDLGIEADTEMKEESQQTLFKVIPKNKEESLDKIREALNVYLNIPKDFDIQVAQNNDVAVMQWQANVMHWKSQTMLAQSVIQMKDATIEALQLSNYQYKELLDNKKAEEKPKNEEEIAGGLVKVKELDVKGLSLNLPELLRRLKRRFK